MAEKVKYTPVLSAQNKINLAPKSINPSGVVFDTSVLTKSPIPSLPAPSIVAPSLPAPSLPAPSIVAPSIVAPSIVAPSLPAPSIVAPSLPAPSIPVNSISEPYIVKPTVVNNSLKPEKQVGFLSNIGKSVGILLDGVSKDHTIVGKFASVLQGKPPAPAVQKAAQQVTFPGATGLSYIPSMVYPSSPAQSASFLPQINKVGGSVSVGTKWYQNVPVWAWFIMAPPALLGIGYLLMRLFKRRR